MCNAPPPPPPQIARDHLHLDETLGERLRFTTQISVYKNIYTQISVYKKTYTQIRTIVNNIMSLFYISVV